MLLLRSIPGVGIRTAEAVAAFIDDPDRFRDAKAIGRYFGLVPSQDQSGPRNRLGHITREGPPVVRQLVAEATWQALRRSLNVRACFERVRRGDPLRKKIALVATAHYLVRVIMRRRGVERERPQTLSSRSAIADEAEWMSGKSRNRLAPVLTEASFYESSEVKPWRLGFFFWSVGFSEYGRRSSGTARVAPSRRPVRWRSPVPGSCVPLRAAGRGVDSLRQLHEIGSRSSGR